MVADTVGKAQGARILAAAAVSEVDIRELLANRIESGLVTWFDVGSGALKAEHHDRLGHLVLAKRPAKIQAGEAAARALIEALCQHGLELLPWSETARSLRQRLAFLHHLRPEEFPDVSDQRLLERLDEWLLPFLSTVTRFSALTDTVLASALTGLVASAHQRSISQLAPVSFEVPTGSNIQLRYENNDVVLAVRVQELFGLKNHPAILGGKYPLLLELLSPAHRPIQTTRDLPAFWSGTWKEVRIEMRGRYPRHVWPEDPASAAPTQRAKPRGT